MRDMYDFRSAVTFLLVGLGIGAALAVVLGPPPTEEKTRVEREKKSL